MDDFVTRSLATLVGALAAFGLAALREWRKDRRDQMERFKTALFILVIQRDFLRNLYEQQLRPKRDDAIRAFSITTILSAPPLDRLDVAGLAFLLNKGQSELLHQLTKAEEGYRGVLALLEARNAVHLTFQEKLEAAKDEFDGTLSDMERIAGVVTASHLKNHTTNLFEQAEAAIQTNHVALVAAHARFIQLYKEEIFGIEDQPIKAAPK